MERDWVAWLHEAPEVPSAAGIVGAVLLLLGPAVVGVGYANVGIAASNSVNCTANCSSVEHAAANATFLLTLTLGAGIIVGGVGAGLVLAAAVRFMSRWPPAGASEGAPPP
jgi:hypothetical protein